MRALFNNYLKTSTNTISSEKTGYAFDDMIADTRRSRIFKTDASTTLTMTFDLGSAKKVYYLSFFNHNFTSSASIHIYGNSSNSWTTPAVSFEVTRQDAFCLYELDDTVTAYRYWRVTITDSGNTDGYLKFSKMYIGDYIQLPYMSRNQKIPKDSTSTVSESDSLQAYGDKGIFYQYGTINFPLVDDTDKLDMDDFFEAVDKYVPFILLVWADDLDSQPPIYSRLTSGFEWSRVESDPGKRWSLSFQFKETF